MRTNTELKQPARLYCLNGSKEGEPPQLVRRFLDIKEVEHRTRQKKSAIYAGMAAGTFPKNIRLPFSRSVAWLSSDIEAWIDAALLANGRSLDFQQVINPAQLVGGMEVSGR